MQEVLMQVLGYAWGIWRYRWQAIIIAWLVCLIGWVWIYQLPEQYLAKARIHVDTNTVLRPLLRGLAIQPDIDQKIELLTKTILTRPNLEQLLRMTDMDINVKNDLQKDQLLDSIKENITIIGDKENTSLFAISFTHPDRNMSTKVVQSLITILIENSLGGERADSADAQKFLDQQIYEYEKRLSESESKLAKFKQKYVGILPGQEGDYYSRLSTEQATLKQATLELNQAVQRRNELRRQVEGEDPVFLSNTIDQQIQSPLDARINALKARMDELLTRYTEKYPEVVQIKKLIADLKEEKQQEIDKALEGESAEYVGLQESPVYQQMRTMLAEAEARVAETTVRVDEYKNRVQELEDMVEKIPLIEAELKQLNRDYEVVQQQHSELLSRRESALISQGVEQKSKDLVFRVIDPPFVPQEPNEPNKLLLNSAVLLAGLGVGGGLALLWSLLYPVVLDRYALARVSGLPVLGTVSLISTVEERRATINNRMKFGGISLMLILFFVGTIFL